MRGNRLKLFEIIESCPARVNDLSAATGIPTASIYNMLSHFKRLGIVRAEALPRSIRGRPQNIYFAAFDTRLAA